MSELHKEAQAAGQGVYAVPTGAHVKDNEQVRFTFLVLITTCTSHMVLVLVLLCVVAH